MAKKKHKMKRHATPKSKGNLGAHPSHAANNKAAGMPADCYGHDGQGYSHGGHGVDNENYAGQLPDNDKVQGGPVPINDDGDEDD